MYKISYLKARYFCICADFYAFVLGVHSYTLVCSILAFNCKNIFRPFELSSIGSLRGTRLLCNVFFISGQLHWCFFLDS